MKRTRKGFTLVELVIVIGIIGMLGTMGIMAGGEISNAATANKIIEDFKMLSSALNMYYADNKISCDRAGATLTGDKIRDGLATYIKSTDIIATGTAPVAGKYLISVVGGTDWYLTYLLNGDNTKVGKILLNKSVQEGLYNKAPTGTTAPAAYDGKKTVTYKAK